MPVKFTYFGPEPTRMEGSLFDMVHQHMTSVRERVDELACESHKICAETREWLESYSRERVELAREEIAARQEWYRDFARDVQRDLMAVGWRQ